MMKNDYIEYWKSCIKHQNDFPELVFPVLGGGEVATSSKFRFGKPRLLFFKIEHFKLQVRFGQTEKQNSRWKNCRNEVIGHVCVFPELGELGNSSGECRSEGFSEFQYSNNYFFHHDEFLFSLLCIHHVFLPCMHTW